MKKTLLIVGIGIIIILILVILLMRYIEIPNEQTVITTNKIECPECGGEFTIMDYETLNLGVVAIIRCDNCHYTKTLNIEQTSQIKHIFDNRDYCK